MANLDASALPQAGKYLTFLLDEEQYGLEIVRIREILGAQPITPMPQMPRCLKGVINLRGRVIPVVDTRLKFGMPEREATPETCIIVVEADGAHIGILVDTVKDVLDIREEQIEAPSCFDSAGESAFVRGFGKIGEQLQILLNIDQVLDGLQTTDVS